MSAAHYILVGLVVLTTCGGFVEAAVNRGYKLTLGRFALALVVPLLWLALILLPSWNYSLPHLALKPVWWIEVALSLLLMLISAVVTIVLIAGVPAFLLMTIVVWIVAVTTGETRELLPGFLKKRFGGELSSPETQCGHKLSRRK